MSKSEPKKKSAAGKRRRSSTAFRRYVVLCGFAAGAAVLLWRAYDQHIHAQVFLQNEADKRHLAEIKLEARRGLITDRRGDVLAMTTQVASVTANPQQLSANAKGLSELAQAIPMPLHRLRHRLNQNKQRRFVYLKHGLSPDRAAYVAKIAQKHQLTGLHIEQKVKRYYPTGEVFAHVLGFTNHADQGKEGLEGAYDDDLRGMSGAKRVLRDGKGQVIRDVGKIRLPNDGQKMALTLDSRLQHIAYRELKFAVKRHSAIAGSAVLMDVQTGEVLAMVNQPGFNPNDTRNRTSEGGRMRNRALLDAFEPGSTLKPFIVAAALEFDYVQPHDEIDTSPGYMRVGSREIHDQHNLGQINLTTILSRSSNVGATRLALDMDKSNIWQILHNFDFGQLPYLEFPVVTAGKLPHHLDWTRDDHANLAFGYGMATSMLQLTKAYAALANDGVLVSSRLVKSDAEPQRKRVLSRKTSRLVRSMLHKVVTPGGTASQAAIAGYQVAGKTGTVKKFIDGAYQENRYFALFAGFAPLQNPRLALVVMLDEPRSQQYYGGQVAAPVFSRVMREALRLLNISPDGARQTPLRLAQQAGVVQ